MSLKVEYGFWKGEDFFTNYFTKILLIVLCPAFYHLILIESTWNICTFENLHDEMTHYAF